MSSHKHQEKLENIKNAIKVSGELSEDEKSQTIKHLDEWILEDKAEGVFYEELVSLASGVRPILKELGFL